jgi:hypothetical protein
VAEEVATEVPPVWVGVGNPGPSSGIGHDAIELADRQPAALGGEQERPARASADELLKVGREVGRDGDQPVPAALAPDNQQPPAIEVHVPRVQSADLRPPESGLREELQGAPIPPAVLARGRTLVYDLSDLGGGELVVRAPDSPHGIILRFRAVSPK